MSRIKQKAKQKNSIQIWMIRGASIFAILLAISLTIYFISTDKDSIAGNGNTPSSTLDSDNDGIYDSLDEDDDNDGIPDTIECAFKVKHFINGSFEEGPYPNSYGIYNQSQVKGWSSTVSGNKIEIWKDGFIGVNAPEGNYFCELNSTAKGAIYQIIPVSAGDVIKYSFYHRGRAGQDRMRVYIGPISSLAYQMEAKTQKHNWKKYSNTYTVPGGVSSIYFYLYAYKTHQNHPSIGNLIDDFRLVTYELNDLDFDGDGIPNRLDLDSDNDGIYDVIEAGGTDPNGDGIIGGSGFGDQDNDGLDNSVDPDHPSGSPLTVADTDGDGNRDFLDFDSDGDGIVDLVEGRPTAQFTQLSGNDADADGIDDAFDASKSQIVLADTDNDNTPDYLDLDSDDDGISDAIEAFDANLDGTMDLTYSYGDYDADGVDNSFDTDGASNQNSGGSANQQDPLTFPKNNANSAEPYWRHSGSDGGSLPIELLSFGAEQRNGIVVVEWETATETNNDFFTIERSQNGIDYEILGTLPGAGNSSSPLTYSFEDHKLKQGTMYYRLKQTDYDGKCEYFKPVILQLSSLVSQIRIQKIYPNPFQSSLKINILSEIDHEITLNIYNTKGQLMVRKVENIEEGNNQIHLHNLDNMVDGYYYLNLVCEGLPSESISIIKTR